ncbi:hypothetical protein BZA77DRAFT_239420 [Pyronema omphalodes]|nr:hypothetical protein BZA77DRAFT_239420 [Pyronema omphalodes]
MFGPGTPVLRSNSITSAISGHSSNGTPGSPVQRADSIRRTRGRSSTLSSLENGGRNSLGNSFLNRIRRESDSARSASPQPHLAFSAPASGKASREIFIPERNDTDTPPIYLSKLLEALSKSVVASLLARNGDPFHLAVLKSYMETFQFADDPMDMALRKLLMEVELPSETQQIDRVLQAFADRYHECNPFIYKDSDQAYYIAFSLIMLHTDFFNRNNKHKMQKADYVKNTSRAIDKEGISTDILECFYANIIYTPFIRLEDEFDINGQKIVPHRPKKNFFHRAVTHNDGKRIKEPVDPYLLIIENQLDLLRASLKDVVQFEDPYSYSGTASRLDMGALHKAFFRSGVLQIVSARSRPDAFMTQQSMENPDGADPGVVEIKVTKVGLLWRKEVKRKKTRSPWQEWGAVLTGSQLYFFRNIAWVKSLINQYETHHKQGTGTPVVFKPPLEQFKPDAQISTDDAVALLDKSYKKHKNAFAFIRHGGIQEYFIADSEADMNDWLAKLNYAATFRTAGVRMRGVVGGNYDGQRARGMRRMEGTGNPNASSVITPTGEVSIVRGGIDVKLAAEIAAARREVVEQRIFDSEDKIAQANKELQTCLRNGRHLTILTPIQPRTREQVVMAAATLAAKLQWVRMEMWKLRCHRDILALDLEEERKSTKEQAKRIAAESSLGTTAGPSLLPRSPAPSRPTTPAAPVSESSTSGIGNSSGTGGLTPTQEHFNPNDNLSQTTSQTASQSSQHKRGNSADQSITSERLGRESALSAPHRSPSSSSARVMRDDRSIGTGNSHRSVSPARSLSSVTSAVASDRRKDKDKDKGKGKGKEPMDGRGEQKDGPPEQRDNRDPRSPRPSRVRRGLQRTLRETEKLGHRRGKSGDVTGEEKKKEDEGLPRVPGSFTVHGKKASVITFGSEWTAITAEERLKQRMKVPEDGAQGLHAQVDGEDTERAVFTRKGSSAAVMQVRKEDEISGEKREFPEVSVSSEAQARSEMKFETRVEERDSSSSSSSIVTAAPVIASSEDL